MTTSSDELLDRINRIIQRTDKENKVLQELLARLGNNENEVTQTQKPVSTDPDPDEKTESEKP